MISSIRERKFSDFRWVFPTSSYRIQEEINFYSKFLREFDEFKPLFQHYLKK